MWEKQPVQPFYFPKEGEEYPLLEIAAEANKEAAAIGYQYACLCHFGKTKMYRVRYDFWIAPDHSTIATVSCGTVAKLPCKGIWLYSQSVDGRIFCTTNEIGEQDISGVVEQTTWTNYRFEPLHQKHIQRLKEIAVDPFAPDKPLAGYFEIRKKKADQLVKMNDARFTDEDCLVWRYTLKGALKFYFISNWVRPLGRGLRSISLIKD